jgi:hypothetical protein
MKKIYSNLSGIAILLITVSLPACNQLDQKQTASATPADHVQVYEGYYLRWKEDASFVPCDANETPKEGKGYWLVTNAQFEEMYQPEANELMSATIGTLPPNGEFGMYIKFKGIAAPLVDPASGQGYGYQNRYPGQITVTEALQMKYFIVPWDEDLCKAK